MLVYILGLYLNSGSLPRKDPETKTLRQDFGRASQIAKLRRLENESGGGKHQISVGWWTGCWWGRRGLCLAGSPLSSCIGNTSQVPHQSFNPGFLCPLGWGFWDGLGAGRTYHRQRIKMRVVNVDSHQPVWELSSSCWYVQVGGGDIREEATVSPAAPKCKPEDRPHFIHEL